MLIVTGGCMYGILLDTFMEFGECAMGTFACELIYTSRLDTGFTWCMLHFFFLTIWCGK